MKSVLRQRLQGRRVVHKPILHLHAADLQEDISVVSVQYMDGDRLKNWLQDWNYDGHLPSISPGKLRSSYKAKPFSQPCSHLSSPKVKREPAFSPLPSASTDDRSPINPLPLQFPVPRNLPLWSELRRRRSEDSEASFRKVHYPLNLSCSRDEPNMQSAETTRAEVRHLRASFPRHVFGGRPSRSRKCI